MQTHCNNSSDCEFDVIHLNHRNSGISGKYDIRYDVFHELSAQVKINRLPQTVHAELGAHF